MSKNIKLFLIVLGIVAVLIFVSKFRTKIINETSEDVFLKGFEDIDLNLDIVDVPHEDNIYYALLPLMGSEMGGSEDIAINEASDRELYKFHLSGEEWEDDFIEGFISDNQVFFNIFDKAMERKYYQHPMFADPSQMVNQDYRILSWRKFAEMNKLRSLYLLKKGNDKEAINQAIKIIRLGQKIKESQVSYTEYAFAGAIKNIGRGVLLEIIPKSNLNVDEFVNFIRELEELEDERVGLDNAYRLEYVFIEKAVEDAKFNRSDFDDLYFLSGEIIKYKISLVDTPCYEIKEISEIDFKKINAKKNVKETAEIIYFNIHPSGILENSCENELKSSQSKILLAIRAYEASNGFIPQSLNHLIPEYLSEVPNDPFFEGGKMQYDPDNRLIYSQGGEGRNPVSF